MREHEYEKRLMGSDFSVAIVDACPKGEADLLFAEMGALGDMYESTFSRFREDSELSVLNRKKHLKVSPLFMEVTLVAKGLYETTCGYFNPLVQIERFGYTKDFASIADAADIRFTPSPYDADFSAVTIDEHAGTITLREDQKLDFGGFLKGLVAEQVARLAKDRGGVIANIGGDLHTLGRDVDGKPFVFFIWDPVGHKDIPISLSDASMATSGTYKRIWKANGKTVSHILDKEGSDNPDTDIVSATVVAPHGVDAESYATMALLSGSVVAESLLKERGVGYVLITDTGKTLSSYPL